MTFIPMHDGDPPIIGLDGNQKAKILIVGDAPDGWAIKAGTAFSHGIETIVTQCLHQASLVKYDVAMTNLIFDDTKVDSYWRDKGHKGPSQLKKPIGKYVFRLEEIIKKVNPSVIITMGDITLFALLQRYDLSKCRGYPFVREDGICVIPTFHPRKMVWSNYEWRHYLAHDLQKARMIVSTPGVLVEPRHQTFPQDFNHACELLKVIAKAKTLSFDIEVANFETSCIGYASDHYSAISIPYDMRWTAEEEVELWKLSAAILENPNINKIAQNGIFDCQFLAQRNGIFVAPLHGDGFFDTMVSHHIMYPDYLKGLGFLGSIHTYQPYWKDEMKHKGINKEG